LTTTLRAKAADGAEAGEEAGEAEDLAAVGDEDLAEAGDEDGAEAGGESLRNSISAA